MRMVRTRKFIVNVLSPTHLLVLCIVLLNFLNMEACLKIARNIVESGGVLYHMKPHFNHSQQISNTCNNYYYSRETFIHNASRIEPF